MARGDHLVVPLVCGTTHHAIDVGDGTVVHWSGIWRSIEDTLPDTLVAKQNGMIRQESLELFSRGLFVSIREYEESHDPEMVVARALSRLGETGYHLVENNCEHFACWCKTGVHHSRQVWTAQRIVQRAASAASRVGVSRATRVGLRRLTSGAAPWLIAAEGVQLAAELAIAHWKPNRPDDAEKLGRRVGLVTALGVGALTGAVAGPVGVVTGAITGAITGAGSWIASDRASAHAAQWMRQQVERS